MKGDLDLEPEEPTDPESPTSGQKSPASGSAGDPGAESPLRVYDLPFMGFFNKHKVFTYIPVCPTYRGFRCRKNRGREKSEAEMDRREHKRKEVYMEVASV